MLSAAQQIEQLFKRIPNSGCTSLWSLEHFTAFLLTSVCGLNSDRYEYVPRISDIQEAIRPNLHSAPSFEILWLAKS